MEDTNGVTMAGLTQYSAVNLIEKAGVDAAQENRIPSVEEGEYQGGS